MFFSETVEWICVIPFALDAPWVITHCINIRGPRAQPIMVFQRANFSTVSEGVFADFLDLENDKLNSCNSFCIRFAVHDYPLYSSISHPRIREHCFLILKETKPSRGQVWLCFLSGRDKIFFGNGCIYLCDSFCVGCAVCQLASHQTMRSECNLYQ